MKLLQKLLDALIGTVMILLILSVTELAVLYLQADELLAQSQVVTSQSRPSHPPVNGQQIQETPDVECLGCHHDLP